MSEDLGNQKNEGHVTLRDIAAELGVSHVSVSKALRNLPGVSDQLKSTIQAKADAMGYVPDPLLASLSRYRRKDQPFPIQSQIAWLNVWGDPEQLRREHREFELYWQGANASARQLGYRLEAFNTAEISLTRFRSILDSRNIQGVLLPPMPLHSEEMAGFDWSGLSVVSFGQSTVCPTAHFVSSAQLGNAELALEQIMGLGYQRIGFVCEYWATRFFGAGFEWLQKAVPSEQQLPLLALDAAHSFEEQECAFRGWFERCRPDAVLTDNSETLSMLQNMGLRVPEDVGLATASVHDTVIDAGIDQNPYEIGRAAIRMLTALIAERSFGLPDCRNETLIQGKWVHGSMLPPCR